MQLMEKPCLPRSGLAELCLTAGDLKDSLGMRSDAHKLWQQALTLAQQDCQALGLRERQVRFLKLLCPSLYCLPHTPGLHIAAIQSQRPHLDGQRADPELLTLADVFALQVHTELRNLYMVGSDTLIQALMRQAVRLLRQQQAAAAVEASTQAFEMVQQVRCLPLLQAQAAALLGRCCIVHSHTASQPAAIGQQRSLSSMPVIH